MENLNELVSVLTIKHSDDIEVGDYEYVRLEGGYSTVLEEANEDELKNYIMSSGIPNPEHMIKLWSSSRKSVLDLLFRRLDIKDVGKYLENEIQCHPEMLPPDKVEEEPEIEIDSSLLEGTSVSLEKEEEEPLEESVQSHIQETEQRESAITGESYAQGIPLSQSAYSNSISPEVIKEALGPTEQRVIKLEEDLHYAIQIMEAVAEKSKISMRNADNVLSSNEVLTVIASLKKFNDATFRQIVEQTLLSAKTPSQSRLITDFLSMMYECIEN